jgi:exodeoxyribonuclease V alpha subunit
VHWFTHSDEVGRTIPDTDYAELTLAMRHSEDASAVFDALCARGQIRLHRDPAALQETLAAVAATAYTEGQELAVVVDTREQVAEPGAAIRDRLVTEGRVDDTRTVTTRAGQRIGAGDRIATRRNDRTLGVANRDTWTVTAVGPNGELVVTPSGTVPAGVTPGVTPTGAAGRLLPAGYVTAHVELAYATTAHGVQGDTAPASHVVIGEHTGAAAAYVGMTRGRTANTAHLIAVDLAEAREHWVAVFGRDRADLGPAHAAELAAAEAARYAQPRPVDEVLAGLQEAWTAEQRCLDRLAVQEPLHDRLRTVVALEAGQADGLEGAGGGPPAGGSRRRTHPTTD